MHPRALLRLSVVAHLVLMAMGVGLSFFDEHWLPKELADWRSAHGVSDELTMVEFLVFASWCLWMLLYLIAGVGLLLLKRWAACMMLVLAVLGLGFVLTEPTVESGLLAAINQMNLLVMGAMLGVAFTSEALRESSDGT